MTAESWTTLGTAIGTIAAVFVAYLAQRRKTTAKVEEQSQETRRRVEEVRKLAEPTGNGFADKVFANQKATLEALSRVEDRLALTDKRAERIAEELAEYRHAHDAAHHAAQVPPQADPPAVETPKPKPAPAKRAARKRSS